MTMLVVWIEGTDNTGKTTLAKRLAQEFDLNYTHCAKPKTDNPFEEYATMISSIKTDSVFDRGYLGEYVYSQLWRGGCNISLRQFHQLDDLCDSKYTTILIHATAPIDVIRDRCIDQKEDLLQLSQISRCSQLFDDIIYHSKLNKIVYDSSTQTPDDIISIIKDHIKR
jgi:hypothetical protein